MREGTIGSAAGACGLISNSAGLIHGLRERHDQGRRRNEWF